MKTLTIDECFYQIRNGANIKQGVEEGGYPITRIETIANGRFNRERMGYAGIIDLGKYESYLLEDGDLLMSHINSIQYLGRTVLYKRQGDEKIIHGMNLLGLKADKKLILPEYAKYYFCSSPFRKQISKITKKSVNQASFAVTDLKKVTLELPALFEQECIANTLNKINKVIYKYQQQLQKLDELIKSRFVEMFGDPVSNSMGLPTESMTEVCAIIDGDRGKNYPKQDEFFDMGHCLFLNAKNVTAIGFSFENCMFITEEKDNSLRKGKLVRGDVVLTTRGTLGNLAFYDDSVPFENVRINSGMVILRMKKNIVTEVFFIEQLQLQSIKEKIASGSAQPQLPISTMNKIRILLAPIELQEQFAAFVEQIDKSKVAVQKSLDETQLLFDSLMQKYFG